MALYLIGCSSPLGGVPVSQPISALLPAATATATPLPPDEALNTEISISISLKGHVLGAAVLTQADGTQCNVRDELSGPSLEDVQSDAYQILRAVWTGALYHIPPDWEVHLIFLIGSSPQDIGTSIAVANMSYPTAQGFPWVQLSPSQAWQRYDGTLYNPNGIS